MICGIEAAWLSLNLCASTTRTEHSSAYNGIFVHKPQIFRALAAERMPTSTGDAWPWP
jgi:hypothetical protein